MSSTALGSTDSAFPGLATHGTTGRTRRARIWHSPLLRLGGIDTLTVALLLATGVVAFGPIFGGSTGYRAAGGGALLGIVLGVLTSWRRWTALESLVAGMLAYLAFGAALAMPETAIGGVLPKVETLQRLVLLSWESWRDLLTVSLPAAQSEGPAVMPYLTGLLAGTLGVRLALHPRRAPWAVLVALAFLTLGILWGSHEAPWASAQGLVFAVVALSWLAWRAQRTVPDQGAFFVKPVRVRAPRIRQVVLGGTAVVVAGAVGVGAVAAFGSSDRHVLRDDVIPPLDITAYPSPLTLFRQMETTQREQTLFTVSSLPAGARVRLAAMDSYDGNVFRVSEASARFARAGETILPTAYSGSAPVEHVEVTIGDYRGVWLPGGGDLRGVTFDGNNSERELAGLYYNPASQTGLTTVGLGKGTRYRLAISPAPVYDAKTVAELPSTAAVGDAGAGGRIAPVAAIDEATGLAGDASTPMDQIRAVSGKLAGEGFFSNGTKTPSLAGHTSGRLQRFLDNPTGQIVGDDEQYAVATTLIARKLGLPARVVLGFYPDQSAGEGGGPVRITGAEAHVWTEVLFRDYGWVPFDSSPPEDKLPKEQQPQPEERTDPQVLPPPEVPEEHDPLPPAKADADQKDKTHGNSLLAALRVLITVAAIGSAITLPFAAVLLLKSRRRRARRHRGPIADRISGGWAELADVAVDLGTVIPRHATRMESATLLRLTHGVDAAPDVAAQVDSHVFGEAEPSQADVDAVWGAAWTTRATLLSSLTRRQRIRARFSLSSLLRPSDRSSTPRLVRSLLSRSAS